MAFFDSTSTHMLSMIAAVYGVFIYSISFSLEMWFIVTSPINDPSPPGTITVRSNQAGVPNIIMAQSYQDSSPSSSPTLPVFAFVLAALYFVVVMVSLLLILGIIIRSMMCLLTWLITLVLIFLPEAALVLFITIYTWGIESRNGQIELCFYVIRAILNIFFVICVQNLVSQWKSEKQASKFAFNLNTYHNTFPTNISGSPYIDGCSSTTVNPVFKYATIRRAGTSEFDARSFTMYPYQMEPPSPVIMEDPDEGRMMSKSLSTQSLDRRKINPKLRHTGSIREEVILRPISTRPFDYLSRPGSVMDVRSYGDYHMPHHYFINNNNHHMGPIQPHHGQVYSSQEPEMRPSSEMRHTTLYNQSSRTLPQDLVRGSSTQSIRDVAL